MDVDLKGLPIERLKQMVENAKDMTAEARRKAERDRDMYDGHQWDEGDVERLRAHGRPAPVNNVIQRKVDAMLGLEQRSRVDPRAMPRNPSGEQAADVATKALVYADDVTRFDAKRTAAFENLLIEGYGGVEIAVETKGDRYEVTVARLRWEEIVYDPFSREKDFSDASYLGLVKWMTLDQALDLYGGTYRPQHDGDDLETLLQSTLDADADTYGDRPASSTPARWADKRQKRVQVAQLYYKRSGGWFTSIFTGGGVIYEGESPYIDADGATVCPIYLMSAYIDRENRRYGMVRSMVPIQEAINVREERLMLQLTSRTTWGAKGAVESVAKMKSELSKPNGHVEIDAEAIDAARELGIAPFNIIQNGDQVAGQFQLLQESKQQIEALGPNASLLGQAEGQQSGRAIMAQQQAGMATVAPIYDSLRDFTLRCYRAIWDRIRQFWTDERWIRVTDEVEAPQFLQINHIVGQQPQIVAGPDGQPQMVMVPVVENSIAEMDLDIIISEAPDQVTLQQEQFEQLSQMAQSGIPIPPELLIEASSLRDKPRLLEQMRQSQQQAAQAQQAQQQAAQQQQAVETQLKGVAVTSKAKRDEAAAAKDIASIQPQIVMVSGPAAVG